MKYIYHILIFIVSYNLSYYSQSLPADLRNNIDQLVIPGDAKFDSLKTNLKNAHTDTELLDNMNQISWYIVPTHPDLCISYSDSVIKYSDKVNYLEGAAEAHNNKGEALRNKGLFKQSLICHQNALNLFKKINNELQIAKTESEIGIAYFNLSDFSKSFKHFDTSKDIFEKLENLDGIINVTSYIGVVFSNFGQHEKAIEYFEKALLNSVKSQNPSKQATQLNNIALTYVDMEKYEEAIEYYEKALEIFDRLEDKFNYSIALGNIGIPYTKLRKYTKADDAFKRALTLAKDLDDNYGIAHQNGNLGELYMTMSKDENLKLIDDHGDKYLREAIKFLNISVKEFDQLQAQEDQKDYLYMLSDAYLQLKDYKNSLLIFKKAKAVQDSIQSIENKKVIADLEIKQELDNKKKEIDHLNQEKAYQSQINGFLVLAAILLIIIAGLIAIFLIKNRRANLLLQKHITMRQRVEENLRQNELELRNHKNNLERLVKNRTRELENEILEHKETEEALLQAIERAEIANNAKSVFLANMSHELRTPLVGILGYSDLLMSTMDDKEARDMAEGINRTGNRLLNTLSLVLDLARIESDKYEIEISQVDIIKELQETYHNFKAMAEKKGLKLSLDVHAEECILPTDLSMIKVIMDNLVNNAIKFTNSGEIKIISDIDYIDKEPRLVLKVIDSGVGIRKKDVPLIFEEFKQLSEGFTKDFQGSGLGLSITKKFVDLLGGNISVDSEIGVGSTFMITFPIEVKAVA